MDWIRLARLAWRFSPLVLGGIVVLLLWTRNPTAAPTAAGGPAIVSGEEALTRPAKRRWKRRQAAPCEDSAGTFKVITREPSPAEMERLAKQYGFTFGAPAPSAPAPARGAAPVPAGDNAGATPRVVSRVFGEYAAPRLPYGGTYVPALLDTGEPETRFDPAGPPRLGFPLRWGAGATYDVTFGEEQGLAAAYAFVEPIQTKQVYWRLEGGATSEPSGWEKYLLVRAEYRTEPSDVLERLRERWRGLRRVSSGP